MKTLISIIFVLLTSSEILFSQNLQYDREISELFFNLKIDASLKELVQSTSLELTYSKSGFEPLVEEETYQANFTEHPKIDQDFKLGHFNIVINRSGKKRGCYQVLMVIEFESKYDMIDEYERLSQLFEKYSEKTLIETINNEEYEMLSQTTTFQQNKELEIPSISFHFGSSTNKLHKLVIIFMNCTRIKKMNKN